ncbi:MAG: PfkB family carbohydrate kinase [Armatimonadota bacterium]|nr:PfkB family carbohydrate kinase [Armatimonadota bacterium]
MLGNRRETVGAKHLRSYLMQCNESWGRCFAPTTFDVIGLGYSAIDYLGVVPFYPGLDDKVQMLDFSKQGGGPVATAMVTLARLGAKAAYIGKVGDDDFGQFILDQMKIEGVDTRGAVVCPGESSRFSFIIVDKDTGKRTIIWKTMEKPLRVDEIDRDLILSGKILHLDGHERETSLAAANWANEAGIPVSLDAGSVRPGIDELIEHVDVLVTSRRFAIDYTGETDPMAAARKMLRGRTRINAVTSGEEGCACTDGEDEFHIPAFEVNVVDTTGAGDVFHGAFIYGLLQKWGLRQIAEFASAVAAIKCAKLGGRAGIPTLPEALAFIEKRNKRVVG